jgi:hypothetical protein
MTVCVPTLFIIYIIIIRSVGVQKNLPGRVRRKGYGNEYSQNNEYPNKMCIKFHFFLDKMEFWWIMVA